MAEEKQLEELKQETQKKNLEVRKLAEENQKNITHLRETLDKADEEKRLRDEFNVKVKEISEKRRQLIEKSKTTDTELRRLEAEAVKYQTKDEGSHIPLGRLVRMIEQLEWRQQTQSVSIKEENALAKQIKQLSKERDIIEKSQPLRRQISELRKQRHDLSLEFRALDEAQEMNARESDKHHDAMLKCYKKADDLRQKISEYLEKIGEKRKDADETYFKLKETRDEIRDEFERHHADERKEKKKKEADRMGELSERAKEIYVNFKAGKKITMEELQILQMSGLEI